jgi:hypothetical protein
VDFYRAGALVFIVALAGFSVQLLRKRVVVASATLWILALTFSLASPFAPFAFMGAGILLGAGYVLTGLAILRLSRR